jgi:sugar lactone lactonase YvrE
MHNYSPFKISLAIIGLLFLTSSIFGQQHQLSVSNNAASAALNPGMNGVYVSMANQANLYKLPDSKNAPPKCMIATNISKGMAVDTAGTLWVTNAGSHQVTTYKKGTCTQAKLTLNEPNGVPWDVAISSTGTVYVADIVDLGGNHGVISVYKKGAKKPSFALTDPAMTTSRAIAIDKAGNVFVSCVKERQKSCIIEFEKGKMPGRYLDVQISIAAGLEFDANQNLLVDDPGARQIETFPPPYKGVPTTTFALRGSSDFGKLDAANKNYYASDFSNGSVDVFQYPSGTYRYSITNGLIQSNAVIGIAVDPASTL